MPPVIENFEAELANLCESFVVNEDSYNVVLLEPKFEEFIEKLKQYGMAFAIRRSHNRRCQEKQRLLWSSRNILFSGTPFVVENIIRKECVVGPKYYKTRTSRDSTSNDYPKEKCNRSRFRLSKKIGCQATMKILVVKIFPQYRLKGLKNIKDEKGQTLKELKEKLRSNEIVATERLFHVSLSKPVMHSHPVGTAFFNQLLNSKLQLQINKMVDDGTTNLQTIKDSLNKWVCQNIANAPKASRAFFPTKKVICNYILQYTYFANENIIDQAALELKIESWNQQLHAESKFYFRPYCERDNQPFMFCYQSKWQSHLLQRYGVVVLLDAVYKSAKYSLPVFSILVKTNVSYMVVGVFVVQWGTSALIAEALNVFKMWNKEWQPKYFLVDLCYSEMSAVSSCFNCKVYICDYHREQAWIRWFLKEENIDKENANALLNYLRRLTESKNEEEFSMIVNLMYHSRSWLVSKKLQDYFKSTWYSVKEKWACVFLDYEYLFVINTNDGIASQHRELRRSYLRQHLDKSLPEVLEFVVSEFLVNSLKAYQSENSILNGELGYEVPELRHCKFLQNRLSFFVRHVSKCFTNARSVYSWESISVRYDSEQTLFDVKSGSKSQKTHTVDFLKPSCTCKHFLKFRFPCTHICAVILYVQNYSFDSLSQEYRNSPFLTADSDCLSFSSNVDTAVEVSDDEMTYEVEILGSESDQETSSVIVRPLKLSELPVDTEKCILLEQICQLTKSIYESSCYLTPQNVDTNILSVVYEKLSEVRTLMSNSVDQNTKL